MMGSMKLQSYLARNNGEPKYLVEGYQDKPDEYHGQNIGDLGGSCADSAHDTLKEAKRRAMYYLTEAYRLQGESSQLIQYVTVTNRFTGEIVFDAFQTATPK